MRSQQREPISKKVKTITIASQLYNLIISMATQVDNQIKRKQEEGKEFKSPFVLEDFSMNTHGAEEGSRDVSLNVKKKRRMLRKNKSSSEETNPITNFESSATALIAAADEIDPIYKIILTTAIASSVVEYNQVKAEAKQVASISAILSCEFQTPRENYTNAQKREYYMMAHKLMRDIYSSYQSNETGSDKAKKQIAHCGPLDNSINYEARFAEIKRGNSDTRTRLEQFQNELRYIKVIPPEASLQVVAETDSEATDTEYMLNPVEDFKKECKIFLADLAALANQCTQKLKECRDNTLLNSLYSTMAQDFSSVTEELALDFQGEEYETLQQNLRDYQQTFNRAYKDFTEVFGENTNSDKSNDVHQFREKLENLSQVASKLSSQAKACFDSEMESYVGTIGLDKNLIRRIDIMAESSLMSDKEKELFLEVIIQTTVENWTCAHQRYRGDKPRFEDPNIPAALNEYYRDMELVKFIVSAIDQSAKADDDAAASQLYNRFAETFTLDRCVDWARDCFIQAMSKLGEAEMRDSVATKHQSYMEALVEKQERALMVKNRAANDDANKVTLSGMYKSTGTSPNTTVVTAPTPTNQSI